MTSAIRQQVMAEMVRVAREAKAEGRDSWGAVQAAFPSAPSDVVAEAWVQADADDVEAWWQSVEKTIDGEIIRKAIGGGA